MEDKMEAKKVDHTLLEIELDCLTPGWLSGHRRNRSAANWPTKGIVSFRSREEMAQWEEQLFDLPETLV